MLLRASLRLILLKLRPLHQQSQQAQATDFLQYLLAMATRTTNNGRWISRRPKQ